MTTTGFLRRRLHFLAPLFRMRTLYGQLLALTSVVLVATLGLSLAALFGLNALHAPQDSAHLVAGIVARSVDRMEATGPTPRTLAQAVPRTLKRRAVSVAFYTVSGVRVRGEGPPMPTAQVRSALTAAANRFRPTLFFTTVNGRSSVLEAAPAWVAKKQAFYYIVMSMPVRPAPVSGRSFLAVLTAAVGALILAQVLWSLAIRRLTHPLEEIALWAEQLARGETNPRIVVHGTVEMERLAAALERMARAVMGERERREGFLAEVAHDLRTPLSVQRTLFRRMAAPDLTSEERAAMALRADQETERLIRLVNGLLDLARLELGRDQVLLKRLDLREVAAVVAVPYESITRERNVKLVVDLWPRSVPVMASEDRLIRIATNLLDNALHHVPEGGTVEVRVDMEGADAAEGGRHAHLRVWDTGPGVAPEMQERIWERFGRDAREPRGSGGMGLGLSISRALARAMGGDLTLEEGPGGRFMLTLPVA